MGGSRPPNEGRASPSNQKHGTRTWARPAEGRETSADVSGGSHQVAHQVPVNQSVGLTVTVSHDLWECEKEGPFWGDSCPPMWSPTEIHGHLGCVNVGSVGSSCIHTLHLSFDLQCRAKHGGEE